MNRSLLLRKIAVFVGIAAFWSWCGDSRAADSSTFEIGENPETVGALLDEVQDATEQGAVRVTFPGGEWNWHDLSRVGQLTEKEGLSSIQLDASSSVFKKELSQWLEEHSIKTVVVSFDDELPTASFFSTEKILREAGAKYALSQRGHGHRGSVVFFESDGKLEAIEYRVPGIPSRIGTLVKDGSGSIGGSFPVRPWPPSLAIDPPIFKTDSEVSSSMNIDLETIRAAFGWCAVINSGVLFFWLVMFLACRDWIHKMHGRWFRISDEKFDAIHYSAMAVYKLGIFLVNIVPYLALRIVG